MLTYNLGLKLGLQPSMYADTTGIMAHHNLFNNLSIALNCTELFSFIQKFAIIFS